MTILKGFQSFYVPKNKLVPVINYIPRSETFTQVRIPTLDEDALFARDNSRIVMI
jgi:hypothetical protein